MASRMGKTLIGQKTASKICPLRLAMGTPLFNWETLLRRQIKFRPQTSRDVWTRILPEEKHQNPLTFALFSLQVSITDLGAVMEQKEKKRQHYLILRRE